MPSRPLTGSPRISCDHACHLRRGSAGGTDYAVPVGTPVLAPFAGKVTRSTHPFGGWRVNVRNDAGHDFWGMHLSGWIDLDDDQVTELTPIAYSGGAKGHPGAGSSTGPHLHAHVTVNGVVWGMEEYLANPQWAGNGSALIPPRKKARSMFTVYRMKGKNDWTRIGETFGIEITTDVETARLWGYQATGDIATPTVELERDAYIRAQELGKSDHARWRATQIELIREAGGTSGSDRGTFTFTGTATAQVAASLLGGQ